MRNSCYFLPNTVNNGGKFEFPVIDRTTENHCFHQWKRLVNLPKYSWAIYSLSDSCHLQQNFTKEIARKFHFFRGPVMSMSMTVKKKCQDLKLTGV